jgi:hypothetical protein
MRSDFQLQPRRSPEPGRPFVNRHRELGLVKRKLDRGIQGKPMPSVVTCFWGAFGMGKSWLLVQLERLYQGADPQVPGAGSYPTIAARLDLNRETSSALWQGSRLNREQVIRELWRQLARQLGTEVPDLGRASADEWADVFVNAVSMWSARSATPLIMLDTVDDLVRLDEPTFFWLEQHVVERLAITDRVLFIFTSRGELRRWKRFQVRRRIDSHRLSAFDAETAGKEIKASTAVSKVLYRRAFGHPLVTDFLGTALENQGINLQGLEGVEQLIEPPLVHSILEEVIGEILKIVPEPLARLAKPASVLRWVSVEPLRALAETLDLVEPDRGDAHYLDDLIGELQAHHLLYWNGDRNSYEFDPTLRQLLVHFLELDDPALFYEAHRAAFAFHHGHLSEYPQYLDRYVPELVYHRAILDRCERLAQQLPAVQAWWEQFLSEKAPPNPGPWAELAQALEQDEELKEILPGEDYQRLHSEARRRAAGIAG